MTQGSFLCIGSHQAAQSRNGGGTAAAQGPSLPTGSEEVVASPKSCASGSSFADQLVGQGYRVRREGEAASFDLEFQADGKLLMLHPRGEVIVECWRPSASAPCSVLLGGRTMPRAEVVIGPRTFNGDPTELWEPSPPPGAAPLVGTWHGRLTNTVEVDVGTHIEIIVDRSGSMRSLHAATVEGLNTFLRDQRQLPHAAAVTVRLVTFDHAIETPWPEGTPLNRSSLAVTPEMVQPRGTTALLDAIGFTLSSTPLLPVRVACIVTDGMENASTRFTLSQVNDLICKRRSVGWTFVFLAANQDAIASGRALGIDAGTCATFSANVGGVSGGFGSASASCSRGAMFGKEAARFTEAELRACIVADKPDVIPDDDVDL